MAEDDKTTQYHTVAEAFHCDFNHQLCVGHLGNAMLNVADMHSTQREFGMTYLNKSNKTWVLSRLAIELYDMPCEHDKFTIATWVEDAMKYFTRRNWAIYSEDGNKIYGYGKSIWAMIDTNTRTPQDIFAVDNGKIKNYLLPEKECPIKDISRVKTPEMTEYTEFTVLYGDLDVNGHLNSMKYIDHVMDTFSPDFYNKNQIQRIEIAYVAEGHWGEHIRIYTVEEENMTHYFRFVRHNEDDSETELCRIKINFRNK